MAPIRRRAKSSPTDWVYLTEKLVERSRGACEKCGRVLPDPWHRHHRKLRSQGGEDTLCNLVALCPKCHETAHLGPAAAMREGWIVRGGKLSDPAAVEIEHSVHGRILLFNDGSFQTSIFDGFGGT